MSELVARSGPIPRRRSSISTGEMLTPAPLDQAVEPTGVHETPAIVE